MNHETVCRWIEVHIGISIDRSKNVYLHSIVHHTLTSICACYVWRLEETTSIGEPERSYLCLEPISFVSKTIPSVSLGYGFIDLLDGLRRNDRSVIVHGTLMCLGLASLLAAGVAHHTVRLYVINLSSIFLNLRSIDMGSKTKNMIVDVLFVVTFFLLRCILLPIWWTRFLYRGLLLSDATWGRCMSRIVIFGSLVGGVVLHSLNGYWMYHIVRKARDRYASKTLQRRGFGVTTTKGAERKKAT